MFLNKLRIMGYELRVSMTPQISNLNFKLVVFETHNP